MITLPNQQLLIIISVEASEEGASSSEGSTTWQQSPCSSYSALRGVSDQTQVFDFHINIPSVCGGAPSQLPRLRAELYQCESGYEPGFCTGDRQRTGHHSKIYAQAG